jgi:hypothetical protein
MVSDRIGRRIAIIIPALLTIPITPLYLMTGDYTMIVVFFYNTGRIRRRHARLSPTSQSPDRGVAASNGRAAAHAAL